MKKNLLLPKKKKHILTFNNELIFVLLQFFFFYPPGVDNTDLVKSTERYTLGRRRKAKVKYISVHSLLLTQHIPRIVARLNWHLIDYKSDTNHMCVKSETFTSH